MRNGRRNREGQKGKERVGPREIKKVELPISLIVL